jgi:hypothetical protein
VNASDALLKLRVSEKPSQSEYLVGGDSGDSTKGGDSEGGDSAEALLSIIVSFVHKNEAIDTLN